MQLTSTAGVIARVEPRVGSETIPLLGIVAIWLALWCCTLPFGDFPTNDDWVFASSVRSIMETGRFTLPGFSAPNVIAQAYWGALFCAPFGFSFEALRVSTVVLGTAGVVALYLLLRELGGDRWSSAVGALTLAANPLYLHLSTSFMTDVPFTALVAVGLLFYVRGERRGAARWIVGAYGVALLAVLIRQFGLILPVAFGLAHLARHGVGPRTLAVAIVPPLLFAAIHLWFQHWMVATGRTPRFMTPVAELTGISLATAWWRAKYFSLLMLPYFGFFALPFLALAVLRNRIPIVPARGRLWFWASTVAGGAALFAVLLHQHELLPAFGNVLAPWGMGPLTLRDTLVYNEHLPEIPGSSRVWMVLTALSAWATAAILLLAGLRLIHILSRLRSADSRRSEWVHVLLLTFMAGYMAAIVMLSLLAESFDRYLITMIPAVCGLVLMSFAPVEDRRTWPLIPVSVLLALSAVLSVLATHDYLAWSRTRWQANDWLARQGIAPSRVEGGYEFGGTYLFQPNFKPASGKSWWWTQGDEYAVSAGPLADYEAVQAFRFQPWLWSGGSTVFIMHRVEPTPN